MTRLGMTIEFEQRRWRSPSHEEPLLVVDGDLFAHRAYHALPKSIRRTGNRGGGAIVGFANFLLRLYEAEQPRAVLVGWDTLGAPTYRQRLFPQYQIRSPVRCGTGRPAGGAAAVRPGVRLRQCQGGGLRGRRFPRRGRSQRGTSSRHRTRRQRRSRCISACLRRHDHSSPDEGRRACPHRSGRGAGALWCRTAPGARLHRLARRSFGQAARRPRRGPEGRGHAPAPLRKPGAGDRRGSPDGAGSRAEPLQEDRHHGRLCAAAGARRSDANLEPRGSACTRVGSRPSRAPARRTRGARNQARSPLARPAYLQFANAVPGRC